MRVEIVAGRVVVAGGGQAAFALVAKLRALKDMRPVTIVSAEASHPYQRPPLSKKYLLGEADLERLKFRPDGWYAETTSRCGCRPASNGSTAPASRCR